MATFSELRDGVYTLTNRPDLVNETVVALRKALFKFHQADSWKKDLNIVVLTMSDYIPYEQLRWNIPLSTFTGHRRPYLLRRPPEEYGLVPVGGGSALFTRQLICAPKNGTFEYVTADNIFDSYNIEKANYFYVAGSSLILKSSWEPEKLEYIYYQYPTFSSTEESNNIRSWIADQFPDAIIEEAAGAVFKAIGKDDEASLYRALFAENLQLLRGDDVGE